MNLSSDALLFLASKGMSVSDIAEFVRLTEQRKDPTAADRMARHRARKKANSVTRNVTANPPIEEDHTPSVISSDDEKQKPRTKRVPVSVRPDDIPEQLWEDWKAHRAKHRSDTGQTTLAAYRREADRVGWTLEQAMIEQISRGWRGFKAKWIQDDGRTNQSIRGSGGQGADKRSTLARVIDEGLDWLDGPQAHVS